MSDKTFDKINQAVRKLQNPTTELDELHLALLYSALSWQAEYEEFPACYDDGRLIPAGRLYRVSPEGRAIVDLAEYIAGES